MSQREAIAREVYRSLHPGGINRHDSERTPESDAADHDGAYKTWDAGRMGRAHYDEAYKVADAVLALSVTAPDDGGDCQDDCIVHATCRTPAEAVTEAVQVVRGWRYYLDGSQSPVERWVKHADGDWVSLDSTRRTTGDILMEV